MHLAIPRVTNLMVKPVKNILMVVDYFPPRNCTASRRTGSLAKYWVQLGYNVVVVCEKPSLKDTVDVNFVTNFPQNIQINAIASEVPLKLYSYFYRCQWPYLLKLITKILLSGFIKPCCFYIKAKSLLKKIIQDTHFDVAFISAPPYSLYSSYGLGCFLKKKFNLPLVIDFRDIPGELGQAEPLYMKGMNWLYRLYQKYTLKKYADAVVTVTDGISELLKKQHGIDTTVITNGFDPDDLRLSNHNIKLLKFRIVYTGSVYPGSGDFLFLIDAIWELIKTGVLALSDISLEFYGNINKKSFGEAFLKHPCFSIVHIYPLLSWQQCKEKQNHAALLLQSYDSNISTNNNVILSGKLFDYLSACRPILLLPSDNGIIANLLRQTNAGNAISSKKELIIYLQDKYYEWQQTGTVKYMGDLESIKRYSRKVQAEQFINVFNQCCENVN